MHSFGLTDNYVVLPRMPVKFDFTKKFSEAFQSIDVSKPGPDNGFHVVPLKGGDTIVRSLPADHKLYYTHMVNTYENETGIVIDLATTAFNAFGSDLRSASEMNKTLRDSCYPECINIIERFHIPLKEDGLVTSEKLSDPTTKTDFTRINDKLKGKKHCFYYGNEWFGDRKTKASMGIVKYDICSGGDPTATKKIWKKTNWYPSEAVFVGRPAPDAAEDDGILVFTALDGESGQAWLMVVNAATMELHSQSGPFPRIAFTTHGEFYPQSGTSTFYV